MGFFSSIGQGIKGIGSKIAGGASTVFGAIGNGISTGVNKVGTYASTAVNKAKSGAVIVGTNIKNSLSAESISAFVDGMKSGGLAGGIINAAANTTAMSMNELDASSRHHSAVKDMLTSLFEQNQVKQQEEAEYNDTVAKMQQIASLQNDIQRASTYQGSMISNSGGVSSGAGDNVPYIEEPSPKDNMMKIAGIFALLKLAKVF